MASGDTLITFTAFHNQPPSTNNATANLRGGASIPSLDFDDSTDEDAVFSGVLPRNYSGGGVTITLYWAATSATSGNVVWNTAFERIDEAGQDIDADGFAAAQSATDSIPATSGQVRYTEITHTDGAQMDSLAVGETFRLKVTRDADNGSDTMTGDANLLAVEIQET